MKTKRQTLVKVCIMCKSILLETALKNILKNHITTYNECDVVLTDQKLKIDKAFLYIASDRTGDIKKPFTHSSLMLQLEKFSKNHSLRGNITLPEELEERIERATKEFTKKITSMIANYYENK